MRVPSDSCGEPFTGCKYASCATYAMFMLDPQGIITSWNAGVEHLLGYSEDEWVGQHACKIFTPADKAVEMCESEMKLAQETGSATDIRWHRHKNGNRVFCKRLYECPS